MIKMRLCFILWLSVASFTALLPAHGNDDASPLPRKVAPVSSQDLFTNGAVRRIRIRISPAGMYSLRTEPRRFVPVTLCDREAPGPGASSHTSGAELEFRDVALHLKGGDSTVRGVDDRPSMTLNFDKYTPDQRYFGLRKIRLNNSLQDPTRMNELLASDLFRAAGVPAPRVTHAVVELNGKDFGLYVLKEGFSKDFLGQYFKSANGNLYDPAPGRDVTENLERDSGDGPDDWSDLKALTAACHEPDLSMRWQRLQETLDVERFVSFAVMEILTCHWDGYCARPNNYRLYHDRDTGRMVFFPHGTDQLFQNADYPLQPKWRALVAKSLFETPHGRRLYQEKCGVLYTNCFKLEALTNRVHQVAARLKPVFAGADDAASVVCKRLAARAKGIEKQLNRPEP